MNTIPSTQILVKMKLCSDHFSGQLCQYGVLNKDPSAWIDGARQPPIYVIVQSDSTFGGFIDRLMHFQAHKNSKFRTMLR